MVRVQLVAGDVSEQFGEVKPAEELYRIVPRDEPW